MSEASAMNQSERHESSELHDEGERHEPCDRHCRSHPHSGQTTAYNLPGPSSVPSAGMNLISTCSGLKRFVPRKSRYAGLK